MPRTMHKLASLVLVIAACGSGAYLKTVGDFADTTTQSLAELQPVSGFRSQLCHLAARYSYVFDRLKPVPGTAPPQTYAAFEDAFAAGQGEWASRCAAAHASDVVVDKALATLGAYSKALSKVTADDFPGKNLKTLASDTSSLAHAISDSSRASKIASSLGDPVSQLAQGIADEIKSNELATVIARNDKAFTQLVNGIDAYLDAVGKESIDAHAALRQALNAADALNRPAVITIAPVESSATDPISKLAAELSELSTAVDRPIGVLPYIDVANRWTNQLDRIDAAMASSRATLAKLAAAEAKLKAANGKDKAPELADVLGDLATMIDDVQAVQSAIAGKGN